MSHNSPSNGKTFGSTATDTAFQTATEYFSDEATDGEAVEIDATPRAKTIIWYDQATPIFACEDHAADVAPLRFTGEETIENYDLRRAEAYERLFTRGTACDVCEGDLPRILGTTRGATDQEVREAVEAVEEGQER